MGMELIERENLSELYTLLTSIMKTKGLKHLSLRKKKTYWILL